MDLNKALWRKSSHSTNNGGDCIELASLDNAVAVRDSKDPGGPKLLVNRAALADLLSSIKANS